MLIEWVGRSIFLLYQWAALLGFERGGWVEGNAIWGKRQSKIVREKDRGWDVYSGLVHNVLARRQCCSSSTCAEKKKKKSNGIFKGTVAKVGILGVKWRVSEFCVRE